MASHKRSFQCFDAIMDNPFPKPSLPHGHGSEASLRGSSVSTRLEPLEDRGCYLCADHHQAKSMASEASGAYSTPWYNFQTHPHTHSHTIRRPTRSEEAPGEIDGHRHHHHHKHSRRIVLVKNNDPSVRRNIMVHRRSLHSLGLFLDDVSELMQCLIRKLYTLEGRKIDSVQSLLQCPGILVCVGREPFHPLLLDRFRKNSNDKLPRLNTKTRSSVCSDGKGAKKNVNFGPRCDSSTRSAKLSMSSEKLFPNGLNPLPPGHTGACPHTRESLMDDDIEKRVLVNKDGSLSMEMKVRFRLLHDETLHWSTEIKKSTGTFNESHKVHDEACCFSHGSGESCSEAESLTAGERDETYIKLYKRHFEEPHCQHCCAHCQEYNIWKDPTYPDQGSVRHIRSSSSSASSRRIVCKKASTDSMRTMSSEEYTEHVVEKATCIQQTVGLQGDTTIEQCIINRCCSRSEVCSMSTQTKSTGSIEEKYGMTENTQASDYDENRPDGISTNFSKDSQKDQLSVQITQPIEQDDRPVSTMSSSSQILASLKEDQDEEDVDFTSSISRASHGNGQQDDEESKDAESNPCFTPCKSPASLTHLSPRPPSKASSSGQSKKSRKFASPEMDVEQNDRNVRRTSAKPATSGTKCKCLDSKDRLTPMALENSEFMASDQPDEDIQPITDVQDAGIDKRAPSAMSAKSKTSTKSLSDLSAFYQNGIAAERTEANSNITEERPSSATSIKSNKSNVSDVLEREHSTILNERAPSSTSVKSQKSDTSRKSNASVKSKRSKVSKQGSDELAELQDNVEERSVSSMSSMSNISLKSSRSKEPQSAPKENEEAEEQTEDRALSVKSATSKKSEFEDLVIDESNDQTQERAFCSISIKSNSSARSKNSINLSELVDHNQDRAPSKVSIKSNASEKSKSDISQADSFLDGEEEQDLQERAASGMSSISVKSFKSTLSDIVPAMTVQTHDEEANERAQSPMSIKSITSVKQNAPEAEEPPRVENVLPRVRSPMTAKSNISERPNTFTIAVIDQEEIKAQEKQKVQETESSTISETTPTASERSEKIKERSSSAMSNKSKISLKSNKSTVSSVAHEQQMERKEDSDKRVSSAMSDKFEVSTLSINSNLSDIEQLEERTLSATSAKSKFSASSKVSKMSEDAVDIKLHNQYDEEKVERSPSALSTKSNTSVKSKTSGMAVDDIVAEEDIADIRSASAMSSKSKISTKSVKTNVSELGVEEPIETENQTEGQAQSILSTKSSVSTSSNESKMSNVQTGELVDAKDQEEEEERSSSALSAKSNISADSKASATAIKPDEANDNEKGNRVLSAMSVKSNVSTKSNISSKSKASEVSEVSQQEPGEKESEERIPSVLSIKSSISARSSKPKHSEIATYDPVEVKVHNKDRPPNAISSKSYISAKSGRSSTSEAQSEEIESKNLREIKERCPSAMSAKSNSSVKSRTSKVSEVMIYEPGEQKVVRVPSSRSLKSDASGRSEKSNFSEAGPEDPFIENNEKEERTASALSSVSNVSTRSIKSKDSEPVTSESGVTAPNVEKRSPSTASAASYTSARSKKSNISGVVREETGITDNRDDHTSSAVSVKSCVSEKSRMLKGSDRSAEEEPGVNKMVQRTQSSLSVKSNISVRSTKSKVSLEPSEVCKDVVREQFGDRASEKSNASSMAKNSNISAISEPEKNIEEMREKAHRVISNKSNISGRSKKTSPPDIIQNRSSDNEDELECEGTLEKAPSEMSVTSNASSAVLAKSNASAKSKNSLFSEAKEPGGRSSVVSNASADSKAGVEKKANRSISQLSAKSNASTKSTKSKVSESDNHGNAHTHSVDIELTRHERELSAHSNISQAAITNECVCGAINKLSSPMASSEKDSDHKDHEEKAASPLSKKSSKSKISSASTASERVLTPTSTSMSIRIGEDNETDVVEEIDGGDVSVNPRTSASSKSKICGKSDNDLSKSPVQITNERTQTPEERPTSFKSAKSNISDKSKSKCSHCSYTWPTDTALDTDSGKSRTKKRNTAERIDRPNSHMSNLSSNLQANDQKINGDVTVVNESGNSGKINKLSNNSTPKVNEDMSRCNSASLSVTSGNQLSPSPLKSPKKSKKPVILLAGSNDSVLTQTVPTPDSSEENADNLNIATEEPKSSRYDRTYNNPLDTTDCIPSVNDNKSENSSRCRKRIGSSSLCQKTDKDISELGPSCLPNASPTEVVSEWLRNIPSDTALCDLEDEFHDHDAIEPLCTSHVPSGDENEHKSLEACDVTKLEVQNEMEDAHMVNGERAIVKKHQESVAVSEDDHQCIQTQGGNEPKIFDSSVLVMKVLLSPKLDRCNSLPEVSPVYGRKLSTSAQGLLDCMANLQLLDFDSSNENVKKARYKELMSMLKSLWLCDPKDSENISETMKYKGQQPLEEEFKARSSSGVDVNSGSTGSGKSSVFDHIQAQTNTECERPLTNVQKADETVEEEVSEMPESKHDSATPDIASQAQWTLDTGANGTAEEELRDGNPDSEGTIRNNDSPRELTETPPSSNKSSGNNPKKEENETDHQEDTSSCSPPALQRAPLTKRVSQYPDPIWVLNLLTKLEKQFMTHYVNAMDEFKVRWNLDNNEQLDIMISELRDEVRKRIQSSIDKELKKIQGRAGKPRPPKEAMSRESTIQTEQRRRRLKVMRNQSIDPQPKSEDDYTMTETDFSDQRSDDEYCPCDSCLKKKMASKPMLPVEVLNSAPVMMDFDLRKILQMKKSPQNNDKNKETASECKTSEIEALEENVALDVVKEEDEEGAEKDNLDKLDEEKDENENDEADSDLRVVKESESSSKMNDASDDDIENNNISEDDNDIMQDETVRKKAKLEETEECTEEDRNTVSELEEEAETADDETVEKGPTTKAESFKEGEATGEETAEVNTAGEDEIADDENAEAGETGNDDTAEERETSENETDDEKADEGQVAEDETAEDEQTAEGETAREGETVEDKTTEDGRTSKTESAEECETDDNETADERQTAQSESAGKDETADDETAEEDEKTHDETADQGQTAEAENAEEDETAEDESGEDGEITEAESGGEGETAEDKTAEEYDKAFDETTDEGENETAEEYSKSENATAEEGETADVETAAEGQTAEAEIGGEGQTADDDTTEDSETADDDTTEDGQNAEDAAEEVETVEDEAAEDGKNAEAAMGEGETADDDTAEEGKTAEDETAEDGGTAKTESAEEAETADDETAEDRETAEDETTEDRQTCEVETDDETADDESEEECEKAENEQITKAESAGESDKTDDEKVDEVQTAEDETAGESDKTDDEKADEGLTAEGGQTTEEDETAKDETTEDGETSQTESAEEAQAAYDKKADEGQTGKAKIAGEGEATQDKTAEYGKPTEAETAEESETAEDEMGEDGKPTEAETAEDSERTDYETPEERDTAEGEAVEEGTYDVENEEKFIKERDTAKGVTADRKRADEDEAETDTDRDVPGDDTDNIEIAEDVSAEEKETSDADEGKSEADEGTTEAETEIPEQKATFEDATIDEKNTKEELAEQMETPDNGTSEEETAKSQSEDEDDEETVGNDTTEGEVLSNCEDAEYVTELKADNEFVEKEAPLKNEGDVVIDSIEEKGQESGKEDDGEKVIGNVGARKAKIGESAEGGDEAEDDTETDMETDEGELGGTAPVLQPMLQSKQDDNNLDETTVSSFDAVVNNYAESEDGADADGEDSETEMHNQVEDLNSKSESNPQRRTARKTFQKLVHTITFLKLSSAE